MQLPSFFSSIHLEHKDIISQILLKSKYQISEYTFTNLYMWRDYYSFHWAFIDDIFFLRAFYKNKSENKREKIFFFPPICLDSTMWEKAINLMNSWNISNNDEIAIHRVPNFIVDNIKKYPGISPYLKIEQDRANWDYVYLRNDLGELKGKKYANFRKIMNKFKSQNLWRYETINSKIFKEILNLQAQWCNFHACKDDLGLSYEDQAIYELIRKWDEFNLIGGVLWVNEKIVAFTIAEEISNNTVVIHAEKADTSYRGIYETLVNQFCQQLPSHIEYINREQDLGQENLRTAKLRYHPHHFIEKSSVFLNPSFFQKAMKNNN
ncbi:DUF2156 domain-containing protein [Candidatus Harpocratesius sp.]